MEERRKAFRLHKDDIDLIVSGVEESIDGHICRFTSITTKEMETIVPFMLTFKGVVEKTGMWVWKLIIGVVAAGIMGLTALGFWHKYGGK